VPGGRRAEGVFAIFGASSPDGKYTRLVRPVYAVPAIDLAPDSQVRRSVRAFRTERDRGRETSENLSAGGQGGLEAEASA
jgi:hypothetical protein